MRNPLSRGSDPRHLTSHRQPHHRPTDRAGAQDLTDRARTGIDQRRQDGLGHSEGHRTRSRYHRAHSQHTQRHQAPPGTPGTSTIQMGTHCAGRSTTVRTMDDSHHRRPDRPHRDLPAICLSASERHARGTLQRPFACHHAVAIRTISIRLSCWLGRKGDGHQTSSVLHRSRVSSRSLSGHESCGPRPQRSQRSAFSNQDSMRWDSRMPQVESCSSFRNCRTQNLEFEPPVSGRWSGERSCPFLRWPSPVFHQETRGRTARPSRSAPCSVQVKPLSVVR